VISRGDYTIGLRVDVDTWRGTRDGVPRLLEIFAERDIRATFFFSVGPDNMGRHLWRLFKPGFLVKMLRSKAASLYGWDILLRGTFWPGPLIAKRLAGIIRNTDLAGHEVGLHAWDHYRWQTQAERMTPAEIRREIQQGMDAIHDILKRHVACSAAAGWKCNSTIMLEKNIFLLRYNSDCRGKIIFKPVIDGVECTPQIPVTLPTYDELIGRNGLTDANYNEELLSLLEPGGLNVLTIHAEVEGIARNSLFTRFLQKCEERGVRFAPLGRLLPPLDQIPVGAFDSGPVAGREGNVCRQIDEIDR
jgi:undecaprenyl phosphate-alpha-L-ara4FN deformylase